VERPRSAYGKAQGEGGDVFLFAGSQVV
jgi:hypothetical protein